MPFWSRHCVISIFLRLSLTLSKLNYFCCIVLTVWCEIFYYDFDIIIVPTCFYISNRLSSKIYFDQSCQCSQKKLTRRRILYGPEKCYRNTLSKAHNSSVHTLARAEHAVCTLPLWVYGWYIANRYIHL